MAVQLPLELVNEIISFVPKDNTFKSPVADLLKWHFEQYKRLTIYNSKDYHNELCPTLLQYIRDNMYYWEELLWLEDIYDELDLNNIP